MPGIADGDYRLGPNESNEERLVSEALAALAGEPAEVIAQRRPPLPQVQLFPPRFGYRVDALGIRDVVRLDEIYPQSRIDWSGTTSGYTGTSYPSLSQF